MIHLFLAPAVSRLRAVRARTWAILAATVLVIIGLLAWAAVALLSWLWGQAPAAVDTGARLTGEAAARIEQAAPDLRERAEQWVPGLKGQLEQWLPGAAEEAPVRDVSGADIGPVPRYPGLVRSHYALGDGAVEVGYTGRAAFDAVLAHYVEGFAAAGYAQEVISATSGSERHRFRRGGETVELSLTRGPDALVELRLRQGAAQ